MISLRIHRRLVLEIAVAAAVTFSAGCSRLLPARHGTANSAEIVVDTRQDPLEALSGCVIPEVLPAATKWPVVFSAKLPDNAVFTDATCETLQSSGDPLALLQPVIEDGQVYLKIAVAKVDAVAQAHVVVHAKYEYRW